MPALGELAALAYPQSVAEPSAALGQPDRDLLPRGHAYRGCDELIAWPILARIFVIGEAGNAPLLHLREERGAVALRSNTTVKRCSSGSASSSSAPGWLGMSASRRGTISRSSTCSSPGSAAWLTTKNGLPSMALTQ